MKTQILNKALLLSLVFIFISCGDDFLDTTPADSVGNEQVATTPAANEAIINGIYANLRTPGVGHPTRVDTDYGHKGITAGLDMAAQDITLGNFNWYIFWYNYNGFQQTSSRTNHTWNTYYSVIADANSVINPLQDTDPRTEEENGLLGQALTIKSWALFNLVRIYSSTYIDNESDPGVPIPNRLDFAPKSRGTVQDVYDFIIPNLEEAKTLLSDFVRNSKQQIDLSVAQGILANVYLETGNWALAEENANLARQGYSLMPGDQYATDGFDNISNVEWMWGAAIDGETTGTFISFFSHFDSNPALGAYGGALGGYKGIDRRLYDMIPSTDLRKDAWVSPDRASDPDESRPVYTNVKFVDETVAFEGDYVYMRSAEMYLIEAEAKARQGEADAADVLFTLVSNRDPGYVRSVSTGQALIDEIYFQRRVELWGEGVSWFDLKRLNLPLDRSSGNSTHPTFGQSSAGVSLDLPAGDNYFRPQIPEGELNSNSEINVADQNPR